MINLGNQAVNVTTRSRNLIPFPYASQLATDSKISKVDYNGIITVNGASYYDYARMHIDVAMDLEVGKKYTLSGCPAGGSSSSYRLLLYLMNEGTRVLTAIDTGSGKTFTVPEFTTARLYLVINKGYEAKYLVFKPMINEGSTALPFEPYIQRYDVRVMQNLVNTDEMVGIALAKNDDETYTITRYEISRSSNFINCSLPAGKYFAAVDMLETTSTYKYGALCIDAQGDAGYIYNSGFKIDKQSSVITFKKGITKLRLYLNSNEAVGAYTTFKNLRLYRLA